MSNPMQKTSPRLAGGELPSVTELFSSVIQDVGDDLGGYAIAGLGYWLVQIAATMILIPVIYAAIIGGMLAGMAGGAGLGGLVGSVAGDPDVGGAVGGIGMILGMTVGTFVPLFLVILAFTAVISPLSASLIRAIAAKQRGDEPLTIGSAFSTYTQDLVKVVGVQVVLMTLGMLALMACYFPVFFVGIPFGFAFTLVALHRRGPIDAVKLSFAHFMAHKQWHLGFWGMGIVAGIIGAYVPVIGMTVSLSYFVKVHRAVFGDDEEPAFEV